MATVAPFQMSNLPNVQNGFGLGFTQVNYNVDLAASTEKHFTVPDYSSMGNTVTYGKNKFIAIMSVEGNLPVWCALNATAVLPTSSFVEAASQLISSEYARLVKSGDVLSFITDATNAQLNVQLYAAPN